MHEMRSAKTKCVFFSRFLSRACLVSRVCLRPSEKRRKRTNVLITEHVGPPHLQIFHKIQSLKSVIEYVRPKATLTINYLLSSHLCTKFECWSKPARKYQTNENINKSNTVRIQYLK